MVVDSFLGSLSFLPTHRYCIQRCVMTIRSLISFDTVTIISYKGTYWLNPDIANQVSINERKNNPLSSPSGSTVSAFTTDSISTPTAKRREYLTDEQKDFIVCNYLITVCIFLSIVS